MITRSFLRSSSVSLLLTLLASRAFPTPLVIDESHAVRPLYFEANEGQARDEVKFLARGPGYGVYLTSNEAMLVLSRPASAGGGSCKTDDYAQIDGINVSGIVTLPNTGGWDQYQWVGKRTIALTAGTHLLRIVSVQPYFGFNALRVLASSP